MKRLNVLLSAGALLVSSGAAIAQGSSVDVTPYSFSFKLGGLFAANDGLRDVERIWWAVGADYTFKTQFLKNSETFLSVDYNASNASAKKGSFWPVMINQRFFTNEGGIDGTERTYFTLGLGAFVFDITGTETVFGGRIGVGRELGEHIFVEGNFFYSDVIPGGVRATSAGFYLGYRF